MTLREAANRLYDYYNSRGFVGVNTWLQSIGEKTKPKETIVIYVRCKNFDYKREKNMLSQIDYVWDGYPVEFKYIGEIVPA
jgi:hypothetical protein